MKKIILIINLLIVVGASVFGYLYLIKPGLMNYHYAYLQMNEAEIIDFNPHIFDLMITFKKIIGGMFFCVALFTLGIIYLNYKTTYDKANSFILFAALCFATIPLTILSHRVAEAIPDGESKPLWFFPAILILLAFISMMVAQFSKPESRF